MLCPVAMCGCESCTLKKAEHWRTDAFELRCWRRLLRVPWSARRFNQSILKEISPGCSLEGLMLKLKLQYLAPPHAKSLLIGKDPDAGRDWGQEEKGKTKDEMVGWHHWLNGDKSEQTPGGGGGQGSLACYSPWCHRQLDTATTNLHFNPKSAWVLGWIMTMDKLLLVMQLLWKCFLLCNSKVCPILKC